MARMLLTLDVSKFSGWLKAECCRVSRGGLTKRGRGAGREVRGRWAGLRKLHAGEGGSRLEVGAMGTRTTNISNMVVTLDVLKLSGWLKASAPCRVAR